MAHVRNVINNESVTRLATISRAWKKDRWETSFDRSESQEFEHRIPGKGGLATLFEYWLSRTKYLSISSILPWDLVSTRPIWRSVFQVLQICWYIDGIPGKMMNSCDSWIVDCRCHMCIAILDELHACWLNYLGLLNVLLEMAVSIDQYSWTNLDQFATEKHIAQIGLF